MLKFETRIPIVMLNEPANYPFVVQTKNTENWNSVGSAVTRQAAVDKATEVQKLHPQLPIRIAHHTGGMVVTSALPAWKPHNPGEYPYDLAVWSGEGNPPDIGATITIPVNGLGSGVVTGYAVQGGYLGVMVRMNEATRPLWHKKQNPENTPALAFGAEIKV